MRINAIRTDSSTILSNRPKSKKIFSNIAVENPVDNTPAFKGHLKFGGAIGGTIGTFAGIGLGAVIATIATGGLAAPLIGAVVGCGAGAIGGDITEEKIRDDLRNDDD